MQAVLKSRPVFPPLVIEAKYYLVEFPRLSCRNALIFCNSVLRCSTPLRSEIYSDSSKIMRCLEIMEKRSFKTVMQTLYRVH